MRFRISGRARQDLADIWGFIAEDSPEAADTFIDRLMGTVHEIGDHPLLGRPRDELAPGLRSRPFARYVIFYVNTGELVEVVRILSGARDASRQIDPSEPAP